ncbi:MAG: histidine kinase [Saprospiraceae bacterium]|nr:histidine kinase [Saprospiraceae bacterium]
MYHILHKCLFWLACALWAVTGFAQSGQFLEIASFADVPGLSGVAIKDVRQDKTGYLWVATSDGLFRYDGYAFKPFRNVPGDTASIGHNHILKILEAPDGDLWLSLARGGVSRYERATGRFRNYPFTRQLKPSTTSVHSLFFDRQGRLWAGTDFNGVALLDTQTGAFKQYDIIHPENSPHLDADDLHTYNTIFRFFQDEDDGMFWLSTRSDLYLFDPKTGAARPWRNIKKVQPNELFTDQAYSIVPENDFLWTGGWESGLRRINRKTGEYRQFMLHPDKKPSAHKNIVNDLALKSPDEFWIASQDRGLGIFNKKTEQFFWFAEHHELVVGGQPPKVIGPIAPDNQGNLWAVADGKLVRMRLKDKYFYLNLLKTTTKENYIVSQVMEDREGRFLFVGTQFADGLHVIEKKTGREQVFSFFDPSPEVGTLPVMDLLQARDGALWVLTHHSVLRFNPDTRRLETPVQPPFYSQGNQSNYYTEFAEDLLGNLWLGTTHLGLIRYDPRTGRCERFMPNENDPNTIATHVVGAVRVDGRGRTWFGSRNQTAYGYYLPDERRFEYLDAAGNVTKERATLRTNSFFAAPNGDVWACTEGGLLHFDGSGERPRLRKKYTVADGLPNNFVVHGVEDRQGHFWGIAPEKVFRIDKNTHQVTVFGKNDGLYFQPDRFIAGMDGRIYARTENGYGSFDPTALTKTKTTVPIALTSFKIDGMERYNGSDPAPAGTLVVPPGSRYFSFEFAALDLTRAGEQEYEYRLKGFDSQWVKCREHRFVNFTNIPPGRYFFEIKLAGAPDEEALSAPIRVRVAFYQTGWFWILLGLLALTAGGWIYRGRRTKERQLQDLTKKAQLLEKEKAVVQYESLRQQLNPHFLFNSLTSLGSLIAIDPKAAAGFLDSLSKTYRYILKSSERETVPLSEEIKFGESFVKLQKTRFGDGLQVHFRVDEEHFHRKIVPVTLQNMLENAIKHNIVDEDEPLVVEVLVENDYLVVRNNLQKKKVVETSNRRGLTHLRSFYQYLSDRRIEVVEEDGVFTIKIPLI